MKRHTYKRCEQWCPLQHTWWRDAHQDKRQQTAWPIQGWGEGLYTHNDRGRGENDVCKTGGLVAKLCQTLVTPWTGVHQAPLFMGFPRQEYWNGLLFPPPGVLPDSGIELMFPMSPTMWSDSLSTEPSGKPHKKFLTSRHFLLNKYILNSDIYK